MKKVLLCEVLLAPETIRSFSPVEWDLLIRQGRQANLLGSLKELLEERSLLAAVPAQPRNHLLSAAAIATRQHSSIRWEVSCISQAFADSGINFILLKGAAYVMSGVAAAHGRTFSDVDLLVEKSRIEDAECALMLHGWQGSHHGEYDQKYYRKWMHEIPPMAHVRRGTTIDLHHTILPETARISINTAALLKNPLQLNGYANVFVLGPADMVLHSATHLFHEGELDNGLRDLLDLDSLFREFGKNHLFWENLLERACELGLQRPFFYAIYFVGAIFHTEIPSHVKLSVEKFSPPPIVLKVMDFCYLRALRPNHATCHLGGSSIARFMLYIRSHWIKMPFNLLVYHLMHKAFLKTSRK